MNNKMVLPQQQSQSQQQQQQAANKHLLSAFQSAAGQQRPLLPLTSSLVNQLNHQNQQTMSPFKSSILSSSSASPTPSSSQQASSRLINLNNSTIASAAASNLKQKNVASLGAFSQQHSHSQSQCQQEMSCDSCNSSQTNVSSSNPDSSSLSLSPISQQSSQDSKSRQQQILANQGIMQQQQQINMQQQQAQNSSRYKTELCRPFEENGTCKYGEKCQFAHGLPELRTLARHPKYKTEFCRTFHTTGFCPYGPRCHFIHNGRGPAPAHITQQAAQCPQQQQQTDCVKQVKQLSGQDNGLSSSPSTSPLSSACSSSSSSSGKGSSVCSPPSCSESPPALSSSPDSSMLGSSSISCSPNHHHSEHQLQAISISNHAQQQQPQQHRAEQINPFACSLSAQLGHLSHRHEQIKPQQLNSNSHASDKDVIQSMRRNAPGLSLPTSQEQSIFNKPVGFDRFLAPVPSATIAQSTINSSHAFLWLHSQLNSDKSKLQKERDLTEGPNESECLVNSAFASGLSLLSSMSVSDDQQASTWTNQGATADDNCMRADQAESRWPACSNLAMSQASVAATRRTWQMQA